MGKLQNVEIKLYGKYWKVEIIYRNRGVNIKKFDTLDDAVAYIKNEIWKTY